MGAQQDSPMIAQYRRIKAQHQDSLLFYRMGDFYELFFDDAVTASEALDIALTKRGKNQNRDVPLCGVPAHSADSYLQTLIRKGFRVAVCEQVEDPAAARRRGSKEVVARDVVRVLTAGTLTEDELLEARAHNFLAAVAKTGEESAIAWTDISVGELRVIPCAPQLLGTQLARIAPRETLVSASMATSLAAELGEGGTGLTPLSDTHFETPASMRRLKTLFAVETLDGYGEFSRAEISALGAVVSYLDITQKGNLPRLRPPVREDSSATMQIDAATRRNLEISRDFSGDRSASLLGSVDRTLTSAGGRLLAERISSPSTDTGKITARLDAVEHFGDAQALRAEVRKLLRGMPDIGRALSRLALGRGGPRDLAAIRNGLAKCTALRVLLRQESVASVKSGNDSMPAPLFGAPSAAVAQSVARLAGYSGLLALLQQAVADEPPVFLRDGGFVREGYDELLDETRRLRDAGRNHIAEMQGAYAADTAIASLKIKHNNVLGYFIEVPASHSGKMLSPPFSERFVHRQTMAGAIRFTTPELADVESRILNAANHAGEIERRVFNELAARVRADSDAISETAGGLAEIDVASALAELAAERDWRRPAVDHSGVLDIKGGRHPVVEQSLSKSSGHPFVANHCQLSGPDEGHRISLVTGPNMAGKSTYLRQNALIVLLAQAGSFVPAESAHIGIVSKLFSRVGAADELARGRSTFMVEMVETAAILNQADAGALVILDEIGRGTATFDGLSIAWATLEHLHDVNRCRTLFATHYHELTDLTERLPRMKNAAVSVREWQGEIVFLYEVRPGAAEHSYGVQVARLAGMPTPVVARAGDILNLLEADRRNSTGTTETLLQGLPAYSPATPDRRAPSAVELRLRQVNPDEFSPREALAMIYELKELLGQS
ncbi:MAG: DNA mismatch repair protein MutS [Rhodobacteraceae bacterium]|nr:DNA mismatch repair protein MutS [Paracoccaceae bacterium]